MTEKPPAIAEPEKPPKKRRSYKRARRLRFKIDSLPPQANGAVCRVQERLREGRDTQQDILFDLHSELRQMGIKTTISKSSMSNYAKWIAAQGHEVLAMRDFANILVERLGTTEGSDVELYLGELIKAAIGKAVKALLDEDKPEMTDLRDAATALYRLARARATSLETRKQVLKEIGERVDELAKERGLSKAGVNDFKRMLRIPTDDDDDDQDGAP
ncbi:MAG: DUF3486 family protein [Roseitalea sp.]|nr:DUF3486 family protein [Roseitalea sp.]MBO6950995.1 DUF3486 family protein [Rhizobiaceae bacterium]MBO6591018.1 DUF3486 family protein [Roseitalea sp.]MBO6599724.1 DUF3486 family protein [Roseitalea sp.]MBO6611480.1 DUF3486 family protein [Roseitalea sp.]